jgi:3-isopropylmalate/(R)-2-methylmalate dehydratase small subunit
MLLRGKVWKYGENIDTDAIIPARYLNISAPEELARHCLEGIDPRFALKVEPGDILVARANFGCGSSREHAPLAIKAAGVSCVIASSFAHIFYRNAINVGLPVIECPEAVHHVEKGDILQIELSKGTIYNVSKNHLYQAMPYPKFIMEIIEAGGLIDWIKQK